MCVDGIEGHIEPCQSSLCSWQVGTQPVVIYSPPKSTANIWYLLAVCKLISLIQVSQNANRRSRITDNNSIDSDILDHRPDHSTPMPTKGFDKKKYVRSF